MQSDFHPTLRVDSRRFRRDFNALAEIGSTGDGGVHRPVFSPAHLAARRWFRSLAKSDGFEVRIDAAGNQSAILRATQPDARTLLLGSHLDSVPFGGRYDGALGVLAAYEVLRTVRGGGLKLPFHLEAIDFTDEEGTLIGLMGSRAVAGLLSEEEIQNPRGGFDRLRTALDIAALKPSQLRDAFRDPQTLVGFLEVHIEQGPRLTASTADIGVVQSLVGIGSLRLVYKGRADHAGTTPMNARLDPGLGAAEFMLQARDMVATRFKDCVMNVGQIEFLPGAMNIIPATAKLGVEYRSPEAGQMEKLRAAFRGLAEGVAMEQGLDLIYENLGAITPMGCHPGVQEILRMACSRLGLVSIDLISGAGHDTMAMGAICPAGMIFIPSTGGSHSAREQARWEDCVNGADVLLQAVLEIAARIEAGSTL